MSKASGSIDLKSLKVAGEPNKYITKITGGDGITIHDSQNEEVNYAVINSEGMEIYQGETTSDSVRVAKFGSITTIGENTGAYLRVENNGISLKDRTLTIFQIYSEELDEEDKPTIDIFLYKNSNQISGRKLINEPGAGRTYLPNEFYFNIDTANLTLGDTITISLVWNGYFKFNASGSGSSTIIGNKSYSNELESFSFTYGTSSNQSCSKTFTYTTYGSFTRIAFYIRYDGNNQFKLVSNTNYYTGGGPDRNDYVIVSFYKDIQATTPKLLNGIPNVIIGAQELGHTKIDYHSLQLINKEGNAYFYASDLRNSSGIATLTVTRRGDGKTTQFSLEPWARNGTYTVVVSDGSGGTVTKNLDGVTFSTAPSNGAIITITYETTEESAIAFTLGKRTSGTTLGGASIAIGYDVEASGDFSHAEGHNSVATGEASHAEGASSAGGQASHAEGLGTYADGDFSHAEGDTTEATGRASHAQNEGTIAKKRGQTAIGTYNKTDNASTTPHPSGDASYGQYAFIIGNGTLNNRSNALTVDWNGGLTIADGATIGGNVTIGSNKTITIGSGTTISGTVNATGQYQRHGNTYIITDAITITSSTSIPGTSSSSDSYKSITSTAANTAKDGYTLIGVTSYNIQNADSGGANSSHVMCYGCYIDSSANTVTIKVRNLASSTAVVKINARCLYRAN